MEYCKLQLGCALVVLYIAFVYYKECGRFHQKKQVVIFDGLLWLSIVCLVFDGVTAYTVNHLEVVSDVLNRILHMCFLLSMDSFIFLLFLYMISITSGLPRRRSRRLLLCIPYVVNVVLVVVNIPFLWYEKGDRSNYSAGWSAYTCYFMVGIYFLLSMITFLKQWRYVEHHKRANIFTCLLVSACVTVVQVIDPELLLTSLGVTIIILGVYVNQENPAIRELAYYHQEMIMGFATLVENKDGSTGGHIKRTTTYVKLLVEELRKRGQYKTVLTKDYIKNLLMAAPMHDIGKISVPDVILQKPARLTEEEFERMKLHAENGSKIILETFGPLGNDQYTRLAYEVSRFYHEKWNGNGYPVGLQGEEIPLSARIMAIADVFDAVSAKRCYRDAMPLDTCFEIIAEGSGRDFDPMLAEIFLDIREKVEEVYNQNENKRRKT